VGGMLTNLLGLMGSGLGNGTGISGGSGPSVWNTFAAGLSPSAPAFNYIPQSGGGVGYNPASFNFAPQFGSNPGNFMQMNQMLSPWSMILGGMGGLGFSPFTNGSYGGLGNLLQLFGGGGGGGLGGFANLLGGGGGNFVGNPGPSYSPFGSFNPNGGVLF
jgi:hypothetical protein